MPCPKNLSVLFRQIFFGNRDDGFGALVRNAFDFQSASAHLFNPAADIGDADMRAPVAFRRHDIEADAVIRHLDQIGISGIFGRDGDRAAVFPLHDAVSDGIFNYRLQGQGRNAEVGCPDIIDDMKGIVTEPRDFQAQVIFRMLQFLCEKNGRALGQGIQVAPQELREFDGGLFCFGRLAVAHGLNRHQDVVQEMRLYLAEHD